MSLEPQRRLHPCLDNATRDARPSRRAHVLPRARRAAAWAVAASIFLAVPALAVTIESRPATSPDDAEENATGSMYTNSSDLELVFDGSNQLVGIRWAGLAIPTGATITSAWVQFSAKETHSEVTTLTIAGEAADNPVTFGSTAKISTRARTSTTVGWSPAAWSSGQVGAAQRTPELAPVIQQIVGRAGWASGNALVLIITGTGHRTAYAFDNDPTRSPLLHVEYTTGSPPPVDNPPVAVLSVSQAASPALTVNASGAGSTDTDATPIASYQFQWGDGTAATTTTAPSSSASHTYAAAGTFTVTLRATDTAGLVSAPVTQSITVTSAPPPPPPGSTSINLRPGTATDDAEESASGATATNSSDLELVFDGSNQTVGIRWPGLNIPYNATIISAWVQFTADEAHSEVTNLVIRAQAADNAAAFANTANNVSARSRTSASATWAPAAWSTGQAGAAQRTPELKALIQEVVTRPGWNSGNALALIFTGTGHRTADAVTGSSTNWPLLHVEFSGGQAPPDQPPVAQLSVAQVPTPARTVSASGAGSTDTDATPIASYRFEWGDGTAATTTTAPTVTATHTYAATGTYTVTLRVTDTAGLVSAPVTRSVVVSSQTGPPIAVHVGYYDTHHPDNPRPKPNPWQGSSGVVFVGTSDSQSGGWDSSCLKIDNLSGGSLTLTATVDIGSDHWGLWGSRTIPAGQSLILAQTGFENFDGSDTNPAGCYGCDPKLCLTEVQSTVPVVNITISGTTTRYYDTGQILNTYGVDAAGCPATSGRNDESSNWVRIFTSSQSQAAPQANSPIFANPQNDRVGLSWLGPPFPNPSNQQLTLHFHTGMRGQLNMSVYDIAGRLVRTEMEEDFEPGAFQKTLSVRGLAAGMYYLRLRTPEGTLKQKFVVMP